jgi:hypothetical protein
MSGLSAIMAALHDRKVNGEVRFRGSSTIVTRSGAVL